MRFEKQLCRKGVRGQSVWAGQGGEVLAVCPCLRCSVLRDEQVLIELGHCISQGHAGDHLAPEVRLWQSPQLRQAATKKEGELRTASMQPVLPAACR